MYPAGRVLALIILAFFAFLVGSVGALIGQSSPKSLSARRGGVSNIDPGGHASSFGRKRIHCHGKLPRFLSQIRLAISPSSFNAVELCSHIFFDGLASYNAGGFCLKTRSQPWRMAFGAAGRVDMARTHELIYSKEQQYRFPLWCLTHCSCNPINPSSIEPLPHTYAVSTAPRRDVAIHFSRMESRVVELNRAGSAQMPAIGIEIQSIPLIHPGTTMYMGLSEANTMQCQGDLPDFALPIPRARLTEAGVVNAQDICAAFISGGNKYYNVGGICKLPKGGTEFQLVPHFTGEFSAHPLFQPLAPADQGLVIAIHAFCFRRCSCKNLVVDKWIFQDEKSKVPWMPDKPTVILNNGGVALQPSDGGPPTILIPESQAGQGDAQQGAPQGQPSGSGGEQDEEEEGSTSCGPHEDVACSEASFTEWLDPSSSRNRNRLPFPEADTQDTCVLRSDPRASDVTLRPHGREQVCNIPSWGSCSGSCSSAASCSSSSSSAEGECQCKAWLSPDEVGRGNRDPLSFIATCVLVGIRISSTTTGQNWLKGQRGGGGGTGRGGLGGRRKKREAEQLGDWGCPCNASYVSHGCCEALDGLVWEDASLKLGRLRVENDL